MRWTDGVGAGGLLERERELAALDEALEKTVAGPRGATMLISGPAGIGKTSLLGRLGRQAEAKCLRTMAASGSEIEREFGFGVVRRLFDPLLRSLNPEERAGLFVGPAALAAAIFGLAGSTTLEVNPAEASLYGLFWLAVVLAEKGPLVFAIDDAHWADVASLRFLQYLGRRLDGLPLLLCVAGRPAEPGPQAAILGELAAEPGTVTIAPALLSADATATLVDTKLGADGTGPVTVACHRATGGNPLLIGELLTALEPGAAALTAEGIAAVGPERVAAGLLERARRIDPAGEDVLCAAAVLGQADDLRTLAGLAEVERERAIAIVDGLVAAEILAAGDGRPFVHPMFRASVHEAIPAAARAASHARAADLLLDAGADVEEAAAHLLLSEPGASARGFDTLDRAARRAAERGAPDSAVTYMRRALEEKPAEETRAEILRRLGRAEVTVRDPASIGHLQQASELEADPATALAITLELGEVLAVAGLWDGAVAAVDAGLARFGGSELPGELDLQAARGAYRAYDPKLIGDYEADLPRMLGLVEGREDDDSSGLRWLLAAIGTCQDMPRAEVMRLIGPPGQSWTVNRGGRESSLIGQAASALVLIEAFDQAAMVGAALREEGRGRGSLLSIISGVGSAAAVASRRGELRTAEERLRAAVDLASENQLSLMALTTVIHLCLDALVERSALEPLAEMIEGIELPAPFDRTVSGAMLFEVRGALRAARGDRVGAESELRAAAELLEPLRFGPRYSAWRSRLALALPAEERAEALALAGEELRLAEALDPSPARAVGVAQRAFGVLAGGEEGIERLRESAATLAGPELAVERARSLTELGAALRRGNQRSDARERLREASDLAQGTGAERLEARIAEELRVAGAKPRRRAISGPDSLTPAERRVALAAATGATNREIAQDLFVSLRTVEMHLSNTYRKLGTPKRGDLADVLGEAAA
ncbi:MAG TPA: AAA family ATPase [Solirubrobacterales bacterium]